MSSAKISDTIFGVRYFLPKIQEDKGFEGDCAEQSEVKTSQCDVFKKRADDSYSCAHAAKSEIKPVFMNKVLVLRQNIGYHFWCPIFFYLIQEDKGFKYDLVFSSSSQMPGSYAPRKAAVWSFFFGCDHYPAAHL